MDENTLRKIARELASGLPSDAKQAWRQENRFLKYRDDPVKFCAEILHERFPKKIEELMYSFRFNQITIAQSCNAFGKSFAAASMAIFWYKCFEESKCFITAAPPENNIRTILWSAISNKVRKNPKVFEDDVLTTLRLAPKVELALGGDPNTFIMGVPIPQSGGPEAIEARFCADAEDLFELFTGESVTYKSLIGTKQKVISVDKYFNKSEEYAEFFDNGIDDVYEIILRNGVNIRRTGEHPLYGKEGWIEVKKINPSYNILIPNHDGFEWEEVVQIRKIGEKSTVGVFVPKNHTYLTEVVEHNSGKHSPYICLLVDEADAVHDSVFSAFSGWEQGGVARLCAFFNPRRKSGAAFRLIRDKKANVIKLNAFDHENVITGKDIFPGAVTRKKVLQRLSDWTSPVTDPRDVDVNCFEVPEFLVGLKTENETGIEYPAIQAGFRRPKDYRFSYVVLAEYPGQMSNALFDEAMIARCRSNWDLYTAKYGDKPPDFVKPVLGLDVADLGPDFNVLARRYGNYVARFDRWRGLKPFETAVRAAELHKDYDALVTRVDAISVGCDVAPLMRREHVKAHPVDVRESPTKQPPGENRAVFGNMRDQLYWELKLFTEDPNSLLPDDENLLDAMRVIQYSDKDGKIKIMPKDKIRDALGDKSPDELDALILTFAPPPPVPKVRII